MKLYQGFDNTNEDQDVIIDYKINNCDGIKTINIYYSNGEVEEQKYSIRLEKRILFKIENQQSLLDEFKKTLNKEINNNQLLLTGTSIITIVTAGCLLTMSVNPVNLMIVGGMTLCNLIIAKVLRGKLNTQRKIDRLNSYADKRHHTILKQENGEQKTYNDSNYKDIIPMIPPKNKQSNNPKTLIKTKNDN